jgi:diguanylate cyclase (GGDEF)-like protein
MALLDIPLSMVTMIVPVFLMAVGTAYCLHIITEYRRVAADATSPREAAYATFAGISFPTALAVFTTVFGLASLLVSRIAAIQEFALFACFGTLSLLAIILTLLPAVLGLLPLPRNGTPEGRESGPIDRLLRATVNVNLKHQRFTLPVLAVLVGVCVVGLFRVKVETNPVEYFKSDTTISRHFHDIYRHLSGSFPINVVVRSETEDHFETPAGVVAIADLQRFLGTLEGVDKTISFADYLKLVNYAMNRFDPQYYVLPEESFEVRMVLNNYKSLLGDDMFSRFMSADLSTANIVLLTHIAGSRDFLRTRDAIIAHAERHLPEGLTLEVTGFGMVISASSTLLTLGQVKSLSITLLMVFAIMFMLFLARKVALVALVPNLFPIVVTFGLMGWLGIELSMATSLIASIAIGLAVDDTIHYMVRYNREFREDLNEKRALRETVMHVGRPILFTTLTISIGFSILAFSSFKPTAVFGLLMMVTMIAALIGDLVLLPSLLMHVELVTLWDLVRLKLGQEPRKGIPLFNGLSRTQVHSIIMAGALRCIAAGETLFRKGEPSDSMYALISGRMEVFDVADDHEGPDGSGPGVRKRVSVLNSGDVVGEMGLLRSAPRSAMVVASDDCELLKINLKMIRRLQWLYPPTAHRFFFNLMSILCDRVEDATHCLASVSQVDDLTGLSNRSSFFTWLDTEFHRSRRYRSDLSLCLLQVAGSDSDAGARTLDAALHSAGDAFPRHLRKCDILARIDGQTLALLLPQTAPEKADATCRRLETMLKSVRIDDDPGGLQLNRVLVGLDPESQKSGRELYQLAQTRLRNRDIVAA